MLSLWRAYREAKRARLARERAHFEAALRAQLRDLERRHRKKIAALLTVTRECEQGIPHDKEAVQKTSDKRGG